LKNERAGKNKTHKKGKGLRKRNFTGTWTFYEYEELFCWLCGTQGMEGSLRMTVFEKHECYWNDKVKCVNDKVKVRE
jgi:hypothetical protein